jgi:hypothetical protein
MTRKKDNAMLPLDQPRSITLKGAKQKYTYHLRRVTVQDWLTYYAGTVNKTLNRGREREDIFDSDSALIEMVEGLLTGAEGHGDVSARKGWQAAVPLKHKLAIGISLRSVGPEIAQPLDEDGLLPETQEVRLSAAWPAGGKTLMYSGLIHRFRRPGVDDLKRFNAEVSSVRTRGTAMDGITVRPSQHAVAMRIYDDLIESVDGYSIDGKPLEGAEAIRREMDGAHKAAAALELFLGGEDVTIE